jgi:hypothetical protein
VINLGPNPGMFQSAAYAINNLLQLLNAIEFFAPRPVYRVGVHYWK